MYTLDVHNLLLQGSKEWDHHKIYSLFPGPVAANIIKTLLLDEVHEDKLTWIFEKHGCYTVKSGYMNYIKRKSSLQNQVVDGDWNSIWQIKAPPKTKHLLWRSCRGYLPQESGYKRDSCFVQVIVLFVLMLMRMISILSLPVVIPNRFGLMLACVK
jgi:hypothetical protein